MKQVFINKCALIKVNSIYSKIIDLLKQYPNCSSLYCQHETPQDQNHTQYPPVYLEQHRHDQSFGRRNKTLPTIDEAQVNPTNNQQTLLTVNDNTSSQASSSQDEFNTDNSSRILYQQSKDPQILQSNKNNPQQRIGPVQQNHTQLSSKTQNNTQIKQPLLRQSEQTAKQVWPAEDEQQGPYFFLGDDDDDDQDDEQSSQSESQEEELIEEQDEQEQDSDEQDPKKIDQSSNKEDSEQQSDDDDLDQDYETQFDDQIDLFDDNLIGHDDEHIQLEMDQYEQLQKQKIKQLSIPSNFNHYQLPPKEKQDFLNILNQMYYETMIAENKKRKKKERLIQLSSLPLEEGQEQEKVQLVQRKPSKKVKFNDTLSYRLFNRAESILQMVQQQEQFEQINHLEKGKQKPILPLQKQRVQQVVTASQSNKRTADYLQLDRDNKKQISIKIFPDETTSMHQEPNKKVERQSPCAQVSQNPAKDQQLPIFAQEKQDNQQVVPIQSIFDDKNKQFVCNQNASPQIIGMVQPPPILPQQACEGI